MFSDKSQGRTSVRWVEVMKPGHDVALTIVILLLLAGKTVNVIPVGSNVVLLALTKEADILQG